MTFIIRGVSIVMTVRQKSRHDLVVPGHGETIGIDVHELHLASLSSVHLPRCEVAQRRTASAYIAFPVRAGTGWPAARGAGGAEVLAEPPMAGKLALHLMPAGSLKSGLGSSRRTPKVPLAASKTRSMTCTVAM